MSEQLSLLPPPPAPPSRKPSPSTLRNRHQPADIWPGYFAQWWAEYPRKDAKGAALPAYRRALCVVLREHPKWHTPQAAQFLLEGLRRYRFSPDREFRPLPATWLNQWRWLDEKHADTFDPVLRAAGLRPGDFQ